jgi:hypothetical protein
VLESDATVVVLCPQISLWRAASVALASWIATVRAPSILNYRLAV